MKQRAFAESDWPRYADFVQARFGQCHLPERAFNEHWFRTPWNRREWAVRLLEAEGQNALAGAMTAIVVPVKFGAELATLAWISSGAVTEDAQARGAGAQLYFWVYKSFPLVGALSGNQNSRPINATLARDIPGVAMRRFVRLHDERALALCLPEGRPRARAALEAARPDGEGPLVARFMEQVPPDYDMLWGHVRERYYVTTERDAEYLEWRYLSAPHVRYRLLEIRSGGLLAALAVLRFQETSAGRVCRVIDFVGETRWSAEAWRAVSRAARAEGACFTDFFVIGSDQDAALAQAGLAPADATTGLDAVPHLLSPVEHRQWSNTFHLGGELARKTDAWRRPEAVYFTKGDSDRDWPTVYEVSRNGEARR